MMQRMTRPTPQQATRLARWTLTAAAGLLTLLTLTKAVAQLGAARPAESSAAPPAAEAAQRAQAREKQVAADHRAMANRISARNLFVARPPEGFQGRLAGVLGGQAIINDQWVSVGDTVMGAKVLAIGADWVEVEFEEKTQRLWVFGANSELGEANAGRGGSRFGAGRGNWSGRGGSGAGDARRERGAGGFGGGGGSGGRRGGRLMDPDAPIPAEMIERFKQMDPEARERLLERMPPEAARRIQEAL